MTEQELKVKVDYAFSHEFNHTLHAYIDITNDLVSATMLSQILYWFTPTKEGKSKVKIFKDGFYWIAKKRSDWYREIRISEKQCDRAIKLLVDLDYIETKKYKFDGSPTTHIRPLYDQINKALIKWREKRAKEILTNENGKSSKNDIEGVNWNLPFGELPNEQKGKIEIDETVTSITEFTAEPTPKAKKEKKRKPPVIAEKLVNDIVYVINHLNEKAGTKYRASTPTTQNLLKALLTGKNPFTVEDCILVIDKQCAKWKGTEWEQYLRPSTLFGKKFENYLNAKNNTPNTPQQKDANRIRTAEEYRQGQEGEDYF